MTSEEKSKYVYLALVGSMCTEVPTMDLKTAFLLPDAMSSSSRRIAVGSSDGSRCHGWQPPATIRPGYAERLREYILRGRFWYRTVFFHCPPRDSLLRVVGSQRTPSSGIRAVIVIVS